MIDKIGADQQAQSVLHHLDRIGLKIGAPGLPPKRTEEMALVVNGELHLRRIGWRHQFIDLDDGIAGSLGPVLPR
ncbi:MAG: hypothetical protein H7Z12_15320 [Rhodospirillaceae bacterium]|nr:hypothetical protein [Rhodospirillales bacterium]